MVRTAKTWPVSSTHNLKDQDISFITANAIGSWGCLSWGCLNSFQTQIRHRIWRIWWLDRPNRGFLQWSEKINSSRSAIFKMFELCYCCSMAAIFAILGPPGQYFVFVLPSYLSLSSYLSQYFCKRLLQALWSLGSRWQATSSCRRERRPSRWALNKCPFCF